MRAILSFVKGLNVFQGGKFLCTSKEEDFHTVNEDEREAAYTIILCMKR